MITLKVTVRAVQDTYGTSRFTLFYVSFIHIYNRTSHAYTFSFNKHSMHGSTAVSHTENCGSVAALPALQDMKIQIMYIDSKIKLTRIFFSAEIILQSLQ